MRNLFVKTKTLNYIASFLFVVISIMFIRKLSIMGWNLDIFNGRQMAKFFKFVASGKIFRSLKCISFVITFVGMCVVIVSGVNIAMNIEYPVQKDNDKVENENVKSEEKSETKGANVIEEAREVTPTPVKVFDIPAPEKRFEMYNNPQPVSENVATVAQEQMMPEQIETVANTVPQNVNNEVEQSVEESTISEDEERERLQSKIREVMRRMNEREKQEKESQKETLNTNVAPVVEPEVTKKESTPVQKILEPMQFDGKGKNPLLQNMNFKKITPEDNSAMERILIGAGFKLLSEIRIGTTGIDYLAVGKEKLVVVQLDTTDGNWSASEDVVEGSNGPVWFGENGTKISPVARAIEARNNVENLIQGHMQIPVETFACLVNSNVVNVEDMQNEWEKLGVRVARLRSTNEIEDGIKQLGTIFPNSSQESPSEEEMTQLISILEKAEIPE